MRYDKVNEARIIASHFVELAKAALLADTEKRGGMFGSKLTGALRRQSMELTRILAEMRKP